MLLFQKGMPLSGSKRSILAASSTQPDGARQGEVQGCGQKSDWSTKPAYVTHKKVRITMADFQKLRADRFLFLKALYDATGGDEYHFVSQYDVGALLGFDREYTSSIAQYLKGEGLIEYRAFNGIISICHNGVREVENAESQPDKATHYFPPVNNIIIGNMVNSTIQQASPDATQVFLQGDTRVNDLRDLIGQVKSNLDPLSLPPNTRQDVEADISTIEAQLAASRPKTTIVAECLASIRTILEEMSGSTLAAGLSAGITRFLAG